MKLSQQWIANYFYGGWRYELVTQRRNQLERFQRGISVVLLFRVRQFVVRHETRMLFQLVVALWAVGPTLPNPLPRPHIMSVRGQRFRKL